MKQFFLIGYLFLSSLADASGCDWNDHSINGWDTTVLEVLETSTVLYSQNQYNFTCTDWGVATLTSKTGPAVAFKKTAARCEDLEKTLQENEGKPVLLLNRRVQFQAYDNCGTNVGMPVPSNQQALELQDRDGHKTDFVSPSSEEGSGSIL